MKFKATFTDNGVRMLERRFVPAFEKIGKICHVYLTREHFILLQNVLNADGVQAFAQINQEALFEEYRISSQNDDCIAFTVDLTLLLRALRSSVNVDGEQLQVKLVKKRPVAMDRPMPYLTFESKGYKTSIIQDVPISNPLSRADVHELQTVLSSAQELPQTLVEAPDLQQLLNLVDRLKNVGEVLDIGVTQYGDLHLQISTTFVTIGSHYQRLKVVGVQDARLTQKPEK
eukprot:TRINITY_DN14864_c0_g1_i2.p1 TRINITY_DN14864_c0_g1~~TRINITY_DN14864_c0_g1_i2.p1  ORF type:complete len:230 (+),score=43.43 TRINITY_DN14864_c0_g1_i2:108-797(+)